MRERDPRKESINKGDLLLLGHSGTGSTFSGYGLSMQDKSKERLVGLLMVDRPNPVDLSWLREVEATYGSYQLVPMTATNEKGIVCQMNIEPESQRFLHRLPGPKSAAIERALTPFLEELPKPIFNLWWDEEVRLWRSLMPAQMELLPEIREVFENTGYGCLAAETTRGAVHICHAADKDIQGFVNQPVIYRWQLIKMPTAPLIRLELLILDNPQNPYRFESFLYIGDTSQVRILYELAGQEKLFLTFYGDDLKYCYTKEVGHDEQQWQKIDEITIEAIDYWNTIPLGFRDNNQARAEFIRVFP